jgi:hypothetical protein
MVREDLTFVDILNYLVKILVTKCLIGTNIVLNTVIVTENNENKAYGEPKLPYFHQIRHAPKLNRSVHYYRNVTHESYRF